MINIKEKLNRNTIYIIIVFGLVGIAMLNFTGWFFLQTFKSDLIRELKKQIINIGQMGSRLMNGNDLEIIYPGMENSATVLYYQQLLYDIKINNELENIVLTDLTGRLLIDFRLNYTIGDTLFTFPLRLDLLNRAAIGETPEPFLTKFTDQYFLSAYLPIFNNFEEPVGVLIIDAPLKFFSTLRRFELGTVYIGLTGLVILFIFSVIIIIATKRLFSVEDQMKENERLAQLGQMAASVAHEIRNPLSIMKGTADVLKKKYKDINDEMFSYIPDEIDRLNSLVDDFLQFARQRVLNLQKINLNEIFQEFSAQIKDPRIIIHSEQALPAIKADRNALKQVLLNLINNATDEIDSEGHVEIGAHRQNPKSSRLEIKISDTGKGISTEELTQVFNPFYSTKASGSGLGLAISKQLVEQMSGQISIKSEPSAGTEITLILNIY
jgi:signal transduction histidine kinase